MDDTITYDAIKSGDIKAFEAFYREFYASMCVVAMRFVADRAAAQDIVQETFIRLWKKEDLHKDIPHLKTFLYVSVKNRCLNYLRDNKASLNLNCRNVEDSEAAFRDCLIEEETYRIINDAVDSLAPQSRKIIKMCLSGKSNGEISEILGISINSVKTLKYNALNKLRVVLKDYFYVLLLFMMEK